MKKILIAEDDKFLQDLVAHKLTDAGYQILKVSDGDEVVSELVMHQPDLLLLDIDLPNRNGFEILEEVRDTLSISGISVIVFTNDDSQEVKTRAEKFKATYFLKAMTGTGELVDAVAKILS